MLPVRRGTYDVDAVWISHLACRVLLCAIPVPLLQASCAPLTGFSCSSVQALENVLTLSEKRLRGMVLRACRRATVASGDSLVLSCSKGPSRAVVGKFPKH